MSDDRVTARQAMERAKEVDTKINGHEKECALRYANLEQGQARLERSQDKIEALLLDQSVDRKKEMSGIYRFLWGIAFGLFGAMFTIILFLVKTILGAAG
ncbi:MAG: hypothetical protein AAGC58_04555 [Asticcacaulis sp.]